MRFHRARELGKPAIRPAVDSGLWTTDLPMQVQTKYETGLNPQNAKALGFTVPFPLLGRADEVIE